MSGGPANDDADRLRRFEEMRPRLFGIAYRMLQTREDAEEVVQEAWIRLAGAAEVASVEGFLLTATTRLCLDREKSARTRRERYVGPWLPDLVVTDEAPDEEVERLESLNLGLLRVLLTLPPVDRAVFLLREAFGYPYDEVARIVDRKPDACRQIARRSRERVRAERVDVTIESSEHERLLDAFLRASREGDLEHLEALLAEDVVLIADSGGRVVAARVPVRGRNNVARFLTGIARKAPGDVSVRIRSVNGTPAAAVRIDGVLTAVFLLGVDGGEVRRVFAMRNPEKLAALD